MEKIYKTTEVSDSLNAIEYIGKENDIKIKICYPKGNIGRKLESINEFWTQYERLMTNKSINY